MKQFLVVAYDIADDRRRQKIAKVLEQHGIRCNESVFECVLTGVKIKNLKLKLSKLANENEDIILYYYLCQPCVMKRDSFGKRPEWQPEIILI
ncbi:MAG TPA: CRISPR-associated endonuclease Cas2 [Bacteroidales bacterium]|nr:CRISPR-associated endonuclease Cas2 [Bacteroidales bacterium]